MLPIIKKFYKTIENRKVLEVPDMEAPITHVHVFHKEYPRMPYVDLPRYDTDSELEVLFGMRESTRVFSDEPLKRDEIAKILGSCRIVDASRQPERRTYPSGGARFPVELYLVSFNIVDVESGAYHYNMKKGRLEQLWKKDLISIRRELISPYLENPAATIIFTAVISRSEVKYGARAYPYALIETGHMGQNIHLACAEIGIGSCSVSGFVDSTVKEMLDVTDGEIPIYTISIGRKRR